MKPELTHDLEQARIYLKLVTQEENPKVNFQTYDDSPKKVKGLTKALYGTFEEHKDKLIELNYQGACVAVAVNKCESYIRKADHVTEIRAVFVDDDSGSLMISNLKLKPSLVVKSRRGFHVYWFLVTGEDLKKFKEIQLSLSSHLGTDPKVCTLPFAMRVPGFCNMKDSETPYLVHIVEMNDVRYTLDQILEAYPLISSKKPKGLSVKKSSGNANLFKDWVNDLSTAEGSANPNGGRNATLVLIVREGLGSGVPESDLLEIMKDYCHRSGEDPHVAEEMLARHIEQHRSEPFDSFFVNIKGKLSLNPYIFAKRYLEERNYADKICYHRDDFFVYKNNRYVTLPATDLKADIIFYLQNNLATQKVAGKFANDVYSHISGISFVSSDLKIPCFLDGSKANTKNLIPVQNGILDVDLFIAGEKDFLLPHTSKFFSKTCLPYEYNPEASCPIWLKFLEEVLPCSDTRKLLQEWFGYNLIFSNQFQKFMIYLGEGANGKSVVCLVQRSFLGEDNVSTLALESMNLVRSFPLASTEGKLANIAEEMGEMDKAAEGLIKQFVMGGAMTVEKKHRDPYILFPTARLTFATNILPRFFDRTDGLFRRLFIINFPIQILDEKKQNKNLVNPKWWVDSGELPGVLNWALEGLKRLLKRGHFIEPKSMIEVREAFKKESNPAKIFLTENIKADEKGKLFSFSLHNFYLDWCKTNGYSPLGPQQFSLEVKRIFKDAYLSKNPQNHPQLDVRSRVWSGIDFMDSNVAFMTSNYAGTRRSK